MKGISIIIPTFNEKENLQELFTRIDNSLNCVYECIIVDDNSVDGTGEFAEELSRKYPIKVIHRKSKRGLASAVVEGFKHALGNIFVVMDADLQHSPEKIPELIEELEKETDMAILFMLTEFFGMYYLISELFGIGGAVLWNFTVNTWWTWKVKT